MIATAAGKGFGLAAVLLLCADAARAQSACGAPAARQFADEGGPHVDLCSALNPDHYPPTSGAHYPIWADPGAYRAVINPGYWLHSAEHGAVVFLINCRLDPECQADFGRFQAIADAFPDDPACGDALRHRIIITGDTIITTKYAAVAWNWSLESDCFDSSAFAGFLAAHYNQAPEDICGGGTDFTGTGTCNAPLSLARPWRAERDGGASARNDRKAAMGPGWPGLPPDIRPDGRSRERR
jgi:hypothetical protein